MWKRFLKNVNETWYEFQAGPQKSKVKRFRFKPRLLKNKPIPQPKAAKRLTKNSKVLKTKLATLPAQPKEPKPAKSWNDHIDTPQERVRRIENPEVNRKIKRSRRFYPSTMAATQKHLLFMGPGDDAMHRAIAGLTGGEFPVWAQPFKEHLTTRNGRLYFDDRRMLFKEEKRSAVKKLYFDPKEGTGIQPITDTLRLKYPNVSRGDVTRILRSLETYQLNFGRRLPPKVLGRMSLLQPGVIAMDMFFPSANLGWMKTGGCLAMMDCWSRFMHVYVLDSKKFDVVLKAMNLFLSEFASYGFTPRRILSDKGSDMAPAKKAIEKYRRKKDGTQSLVLKSVTGGPVNIVESLNAQIQRKMQVFRTSGLTDDPSVICDDISHQINNQKRPDRGNLTPIQLLGLTKEERTQINDMHQDRTVSYPSGLKPIPVGATVRVLMMTRKEQKGGLGAKYKGFAPKWSKETFTVLKRTHLRKNKDAFRYFVGVHQSYFRHELLVVPRKTDRTVPTQYVRHNQKIIQTDDYEEAYEAGEWDSDDSRA